jgi:hypothetical protein
MTIATNNTNKASGDAIPYRRQYHPNFADNALNLLLIRGQSSSSVTAADRIQRNSDSGTYVRRSGLVEALEELFHHTSSRDSPDTCPTTNPQRRLRHSLNPDSVETRRRNMSAILSEACRLAEACQLVEDDDESDDL